MEKQIIKSFKRFHFPVIDSTSAWAKANLDLLDQKKINLITADLQNRGRGKEKRVWVSPPMVNIYATICFFLPSDEKNLANFTQAISISICKTLEEIQFTPKIKWPNDILISKKKLAGILCEIKNLEPAKCVLIGVGLNVNMTAKQLKLVGQPATSLFVESGIEYDKEKIIKSLQKNFIEDLAKYRKDGFVSLLNDYNRRLIHHPGDYIKISNRGRVSAGKFISIEGDGSLKILDKSGIVKSITSGDIIQ